MNSKYSNKTMEILYERSSIRLFKERDIEANLLNEVIGAGLRAPTGGNLQPYSIIKITDSTDKSKLVDTCGMQNIVEHAPVNLLFCIDWRRTERWCKSQNAPFAGRNSYRHFWIALQDTIICAQNICTAADSVGLGSVYIGTVESCFRELKEIFEIPEGVFPVVLLSIGYPNEDIKVKNKLDESVIVHDGKYSDINIDTLASKMSEKYKSKTFPLSERNITTAHKVAEEIGGKKYADSLIENMKSIGHINAAQHYFLLHYKANETCIGNEDFLKVLKDYGFTWIDGIDFPK